VTLAYEPGYLTVRVTDTGQGPLAAQLARTPEPPSRGTPAQENGQARSAEPRGFGLAGIAERVASCGGSLTIGPGQAGGFAVMARLPAP